MRFTSHGTYGKKTLRMRLAGIGLMPMAGALALSPVIVHSGDTLSGIAASHGVSLGAVEAANPQIADPNLIYTGQLVNLPGASPVHYQSSSGGKVWDVTRGYPNYCGDGDGDGWDVSCGHAAAPASSGGGSTGASGSSSSPAVSAPASGGYGSSSLSDVPGVPSSFAACVAYRESTNLQNPAARGNAYGIIPASGYNGYAMSLAQQKQAFAALYRQYGSQPWAPSDGCHA